MVDYSQHKVPDLKKILQERGLGVSGNKADLIARLQEDDKKGATAGEDEIDWDDDDNKAAEPTTSAAPVVAPEPPVQVPKTTPASVPTPPVEPKPVANTAAKGASQVAAPAEVAEPKATTTKADAEPEAPKVDYTLGVEATDAEKEAAKRAARAKKFGIVAPAEDEEAKRLAERAKKFGLDTSAKEAVVSGLDSALPERKLKRGREDRQPQGGRNAKRQTPDRRTEPNVKPKAAAAAPPPAKKATGRVLDDPAEKAKAEARAKKFGAAPKA